jgi:hypothetical protein
MDSWLERKMPQGAETNINQAESWMIDHHMTAALCAIAAFADVAALTFVQGIPRLPGFLIQRGEKLIFLLSWVPDSSE